MATTNMEREKKAFNEATQETRDAAGDIGQRAREAAGTVAEKAKEVAGATRERADQAISSTGSGMQTLAGKMRDSGPQQGVLGRANQAVAGTLEQGGRYLEEHGLGDMASDMTTLIRNHPIPAVLVGIGLGFLLARVSSSSRS